MASDSTERKSSKDAIRNFVPAWFACIMGTGAISILLNNFPYFIESPVMKGFSLAFFLLDLVLFLVFTAISIVRYSMFPDIWTLMIRHPVQSLFTGCFPMGLATLISVFIGLVVEHYQVGGRPLVLFVWAVWWLDVAISVVCCWGLVHIMMTRQAQPLEKMTSVWLLPVVTLIVAASAGGVLAPSLMAHSSESHAVLTIAVSIFMVSIGLNLALMMLTVYLLRVIVYGLPPRATIISVFLPLGPTGQAGYAILLIGKALRSFLPLKGSTADQLLGSATTGEVINVVCVFISFVLWSLATMWLFYALLGLSDVLREARFPFKVPFWGLIFPNGVYANLTIELSRTFDSSFFRVWGSIYALVTLLLWIWVAGRTATLLKGAVIFEAPCLTDINIATLNTSTIVESQRTQNQRTRVLPCGRVVTIEGSQGTGTTR